MDLTEKNDDNSSNGRKIDWEEIPQLKPKTKWELCSQFAEDLKPVIDRLNDLMVKYRIRDVGNFIVFRVSNPENKFVPFINYESLPFTKEED